MPSPDATKINIVPPQAGVIQRFGYQIQPPYSCFKSVNFWPFDAKTGRLVSATRPALVPFQTPGSPVNLLVRLNDPDPTLLAAVSGELFRYKNGWESISTSPSIATGRPVSAAPFLQTVIIANGGNVLRYNADGNTLAALTASAGTVPSDCRIAVSWQGGVWLAASPAEGEHKFFGSRTGDATDWDFTAEDGGGAFSVSGENEGLISDPVTAMMPVTADTMMVATEDSLWAVRGHPRRGGVLEAMSSFVGVLGQGAWTKGPGDQLFGLSKSGLFVMPPTVGAIPTLVSKDRIPDKLVGLAFDRFNPVVNLQYDPRWNCVYITVRGAEKQAWYYSLDEGGFFEMEFTDYPIVTAEFDPFMGNAKSGVLFGGTAYGGLARFDAEGEETVASPPEQFIGPVRISQSPGQKSMVQEAVATLGTEMFSGDGGVTLYCAESGERAAKDSEADNPQTRFSATRDSVLLNAGKTRPRIAGHAAVLKLTSDTQLGNPFLFEQCELTVLPTGRSRRNSITSLPTYVSPVQGYALAVPQQPNQAQTDFTFFVNLARLPASWWATPQADGDDIRVALSDDTLLPFDLIDFNKTAKTGFLAFKFTPSPRQIRIWAGSASATAPAPSDPIGRHNAYDSGVAAFYPAGAGSDRTANARDLVMSGGPTVGGVTGPIGNASTLYNGSDQFGQWLSDTAFTYPTSVTGWFRRGSLTGSVAIIGIGQTDDGGTNTGNNTLRCRATSGGVLTADIVSGAGAGDVVVTTNTYAVQQFSHFANRWRNNSDRRVTLKGNLGTQGFDADLVSFSSFPDSIIVGAYPRLTPVSEFFNGTLALLMVHNVDRLQEYIRYQSAMQDQDSFYGQWGFAQAAYPF